MTKVNYHMLDKELVKNKSIKKVQNIQHIQDAAILPAVKH